VGFFLSSRRDVLRTRRVVFVELMPEGTCPPQIARDATDALLHAVQRKRLFHVDVIRRTEPMCRDLPLDRLEALTIEHLAEMRESLGCDAVLFGRAGRFQPYPRMQLGLYVKLINLRDGKLVWGIDEFWDTTALKTQRRIQRYFRREVRDGYEPLGWELILQSPRAFQQFVAYEAAGTLPDRRPGPAPANATGRARAARAKATPKIRRMPAGAPSRGAARLPYPTPDLLAPEATSPTNARTVGSRQTDPSAQGDRQRKNRPSPAESPQVL
jgi:hypothetical protein